MRQASAPRLDAQALRSVEGTQRSIVRWGLPSQAEFVSILTAIEVQLESLDPEPVVVAHLGDALLTLAHARGLDVEAMRLKLRLHAILDRLVPPLSRRRTR